MVMPLRGTNSESTRKRGPLRRWLSAHRLALSLVVVFAAGMVVGVPFFDITDRYFSSDAFCMTGCHLMDATVAKELRQSDHWTPPSGVRASCGDCHVSEGLTAAMWDHVLGTREVISFIFKGIRTPEDFEKVRAEGADRVRLAMVANDSKNCRSCHTMEAIKPERKRGQRQHTEALETGTTCIACHYNLVHKEVEPSEAFLKAIDESETSN
jgi:nitrate/TMAO reductase-like tetraheme cytochrome c subunit